MPCVDEGLYRCYSPYEILYSDEMCQSVISCFRPWRYRLIRVIGSSVYRVHSASQLVQRGGESLPRGVSLP